MSAKIRGFLLQKPKPTRVRVTGDGEPQEIKVGRSYSRLAETIDALDVELVECLDAQNNVLRALRLTSSDAARSDAAETPAVIATDPHAAMLTHFANLIHRAYEHSTEIAFVKLVDVMERLSSHTESLEARLAATESQLRRAVNDQLETEFERAQEMAEKAATGGEGLGDQMIQTFLASRMNAGGGRPAKNGAG